MLVTCGSGNDELELQHLKLANMRTTTSRSKKVEEMLAVNLRESRLQGMVHVHSWRTHQDKSTKGTKHKSITNSPLLELVSKFQWKILFHG